MDYLE
jgi:hypothetical protein